MPNISLFKSVSNPENPEIVDIRSYLEDTRDGKWKDITIECRKIKEKEKRDEYKRGMPTATLSGEFSYRSNKDLIEHSGIIAIDLDNVENLLASKKRLENDKHVFSVFQSTSGFGLRVLFKVDPNKHEKAFAGIANYLLDEYGLVADPTGSPISKPFCVSYDPFIWINPDEVPVWKKYPKERVEKKMDYYHTTNDFDYVMSQIVGRQLSICETYEDYWKVGIAFAEHFGEGGRESFHALSQFSIKYKFKTVDRQYDYCLRSHKSGKKISISSFYYLAKINNINICSEQTKIILRATRNSKKVGLKPDAIIANLLKNENISGADELVNNIFNSDSEYSEEEESILHQLELYIKTNFTLRMNEVTGFLEQNGISLSQSDLNSVFIAAKKIMPKLEYNLMMRLLKSDFIETYNPFYEFFGSDGIPVRLPATPVRQDLGKFPSPYIDELSTCIINDSPAYTVYFLRKWLVSIISSMHKVHSPLLHCLLGPPETGKTEFYRNLLPKELIPYYAESKLDKGKDDEILMTQFIIIMDDELGGKSKADASKIKNITSVQHYYVRRPYGENNEKILRLAVLCGTSNILRIMNDPTPNRRFIPTEVNDIDREKFNRIDKKELFFECFKLYKMGFDWRITRDDMPYLNKDHERYEYVVKERELLQKLFEPSDDIPMTTTDIKVEIELLTRQTLSMVVLNNELEKLGFVHKSRRFNQFKVLKAWGVTRTNRTGTLGENLPF